MSSSISILGCGWLGFPLAQRFLELGYSVKGSTTTTQKLTILREAGIQAFVITANPELDGENLKDFFQSDVLFLNIPFKRELSDPFYYKQQMTSVIAHMIRFSLPRVIFASSTSVYPDDIKEATEESDFIPADPRAKILHEIEQMLLSHSRFKTTVLRFGGLYGGSRQIGRFLTGQKGLTNGHQPVNLIHLDDCINIVVEIVLQNQWGEIFNACSDGHPLRKDLYIRAAEELGLPPPSFAAEKQGGYKIVSNKKLKAHLNYQFQHPYPLGLP